MRAQEPTGPMAFWGDVKADYIAEFRQWHKCEHVPERVGIPGFTVGRRDRGIGEAPMFFMTYETEDPGVLSGAPYLTRLNDPTPWTRKSVARLRNGVRTVYRLKASAGSPCPTESPLPPDLALQYRWRVRRRLARLVPRELPARAGPARLALPGPALRRGRGRIGHRDLRARPARGRTGRAEIPLLARARGAGSPRRSRLSKPRRGRSRAVPGYVLGRRLARLRLVRAGRGTKNMMAATKGRTRTRVNG